jgi:two-component system response regulator YesN
MGPVKGMERFTTTIKNQFSLFYTLFGSFIVIILLLVSINAVSYTFFRDNIKQEIIVNSGHNLNTTVVNYEKHIKFIRSFMLGYLFDNDTQILKSGNPLSHYDIVTKAQKELQHTLNNSHLYLDNILYYFSDSDLVIDKEGTRDAGTMFTKFYYQADYSVEFWNNEMEGADSFRIYPSAAFRTATAFERNSLGSLMPILIKSTYDHQFAFIVLMKSAAIYEAFHQPKPGSSFMITDVNGQILFASSAEVAVPDSIKQQTGTGYEKIEDTYYFYRTGAETGFTYVEIFSDKGLTDQMRRLNLIFLALVVLSLFISLTVSYLIARRFHNPLVHMLRSIQSFNTVGLSGSMNSRIKEFNLLQNTLNSLSRSNREFHEDLQSKNTLLQQFAYMTRLKKIHGKGSQLPTSIDANKPYQLILFQIDFKGRFLTEISNSPQRALNMYKELIDVHFSSYYADSLTFQMEKDQILTILFIENEHPDQHAFALDAHIRMLELDSPYCNFTIAPSPVHKHSADFAEAYQNVLDLVKQRRLGEGVQVIAEWRPQPVLMIPSPSEESELTANLQSGTDSITVPLVDKLLEQLAKGDALAQQFQDFSKDLVNKTLKIMYTQNISVNLFADGGNPYEQLKACYTLEQYKAFMHRLLTRSAAAIKEKRSETDVMTKFVKEYVESNYGDDLSLDAIAGKLGITGPYLSTYFKEKTGTNFSDYIFTVRMNKAMDMLRDTDLKIQEIASLIGYLTVASFNRVFKRHTGMTPGEFRRQNNKWLE